MSQRSIFTVSFCLVFAFTSVSTLFADRIFMQEGKGRNLTGSIVLINSEKITVEVRGETQDVPANAVASTVFDGEPAQLNTARQAVIGSRMAEAIDALGKIDVKTLSRPEMKADYDYLSAVAKAKLFLTGSGDVAAAEKELLDFIKNHRNSYHYYEICELYGDVMVQVGKFEDAKKSYAVLTKAPWPEYSLKATVSLGLAEINEKKFDSARKNFESVIDSKDDSEQAGRMKNMAKIGLALCLVGEKKFDDAIKSLEEIAKNSTTEDSVFQSILYNSLGSAYDQADKPGMAIFSYYYTDILFSSARSEHIKALKELSKLWRKVKRAERAEDVEKKLKSLYNISVR